MSRRYFLSPKKYYPDECGDLATVVIRKESMQNQFSIFIFNILQEFQKEAYKRHKKIG